MTVTTIRKSASPAPVSSMAMIAAVLVAFVAVAGVSLFYWTNGHVLPRVAMPVFQQASAQPAGAPPANLDNQSAQFLFELKARGITPSGDGSASINDARSVCLRSEQGESEQQIVQDIIKGTPSMSNGTANAFASTAIRVYCP